MVLPKIINILKEDALNETANSSYSKDINILDPIVQLNLLMVFKKKTTTPSIANMCSQLADSITVKKGDITVFEMLPEDIYYSNALWFNTDFRQRFMYHN